MIFSRDCLAQERNTVPRIAFQDTASKWMATLFLCLWLLTPLISILPVRLLGNISYVYIFTFLLFGGVIGTLSFLEHNNCLIETTFVIILSNF